MENFLKNIGICIVCLGVLLLLIAFLAGWTDHNLVLIVAWLLIVGGIVAHVIYIKRQGKY